MILSTANLVRLRQQPPDLWWAPLAQVKILHASEERDPSPVREEEIWVQLNHYHRIRAFIGVAAGFGGALLALL